MKFGLKQLDKKPPVWLSRLTSSLIIILGALAVWALTIPDNIMSAENKNWLGGSFTFAVSIIEVIRIFSGQNKTENDE